MTDKILNEYYNKHKDTYMSLAKNCSSVPEILLKIEIYGKRWTQWDWVLLLSCLINHISHCAMRNDVNDTGNSLLLVQDIVETFNTTDMLDKIFASRQVVLSIIYVINSNSAAILNANVWSRNLQIELCTLLAHVFKKFPVMWNMSWMYAKFRDQKAKRWCKYHRLKSSVYVSSHRDPSDPYYKSKRYYDDFMRLYLQKDKNEEKEQQED